MPMCTNKPYLSKFQNLTTSNFQNFLGGHAPTPLLDELLDTPLKISAYAPGSSGCAYCHSTGCAPRHSSCHPWCWNHAMFSS